MEPKLLAEIIYQVIVTINSENKGHEKYWIEAYAEDDCAENETTEYAELNITVERHFDCIAEIRTADVKVTSLTIWGEENENITTEADYQELIKALEKTGWIEASYEYEQPDNERLFGLISGAVTPLNQAV